MILKFDEPIPTKSGESVVKLWNEMQECWQKFKTAKLNDDLGTVKTNAKRIQEIQDDLGLSIAEFPELQTTKVTKGTPT